VERELGKDGQWKATGRRHGIAALSDI